MSEEGDASGEKSHEPTQKRLDDARRKGDVAKSDEVAVAAAYLGLLLALAAAGAGMAAGAGGALSAFLANADRLSGVILGPGGRGVALALLGEAALAIAPLFLLPLAGAALALIAQRAIVVAPPNLAPKLSRVSPITALGQRFGPTGLMEFAKRMVKMTAVTIAAGWLLLGEIDAVVGTVRAAPAAAVTLMMDLVARLLVVVTVLAAAIAALDLIWVRYDHRRKLRMTLQELRDETKESEGDPYLKQKRRQRATDIATNRMLTDVPKADVVIVNPTHYAVALAWSRKKGSAPHCVAKGADELAMTIREIAGEAGVPIQRDPPTARALHAGLEIGQEIPPEMYRAVAAAIRFAEQMRARARERTGQRG